MPLRGFAPPSDVNGPPSNQSQVGPPIQHARFLGRDIRSTFVVTECEPGRLIAIKSVESTFPIQVERRVVADKQGFGPT